MSLLEVNNIGKSYRKYKNDWQQVFSWFFSVKPQEEHWVLRHINFKIHPGETIGIVGQNGAGKSTLLKIICGTLKPTEGSVSSNGRVSAILELGMGFNPELTGRQNTHHAAGLMGFNSQEITTALPKIEEFAEISEYFDQPLRTYSSGMQMRLAFAIATAWRPNILIVDEALSVGDTYFQHKSFNRIREFQQQGTTLLIVAHDRSSIQTLCDRAILLEKGMIIKDGNPTEVMDFYNALIAEKENTSVTVTRLKDGRAQTISGTGNAKVEEIALLNEENQPIEMAKVGEKVTLVVKVKTYDKIPTLVLGYMIKDRLGQPIFGTNTWHSAQTLHDVEPGENLTFHISFSMNLGPGSYSISTCLSNRDTHLDQNYEWKDLALVFNVINANRNYFVGVAWLPSVLEYTSRE